MLLSATVKLSLQIYKLSSTFGPLHTLIKFGKEISTSTKAANIEINDISPILITVNVHYKCRTPRPSLSNNS